MAETATTQPVATATTSQAVDTQDNQTNQVLGKIVEGVSEQSGLSVAGLQAILAAIQAKPSA